MNFREQRSLKEKTTMALLQSAIATIDCYAGHRLDKAKIEEIEYVLNSNYQAMVAESPVEANSLGKIKLQQIRDQLYLDLNNLQKQALGISL